MASSYDPARPIVFMHVQKCAGTSIRRSLSEALQPRTYFEGFDEVNFGTFNRFDTFAPDLRKTVLLEQEIIPVEADLVCGHFSFTRLWREFSQGQFVTMLREPISRILSHWLFWRAQSDESLVRWGEWSRNVKRARNPLEEFVQRKELSCQLDNLMVRMLLWPHPHIPDRGFINSRHDRALLQEACERLECFAFVDTMENPEFPATFERWLGKPLCYRHYNETPPVVSEFSSSLSGELTYRTIEALEGHSRLDAQLWTNVIAKRMPHLRSEILRQSTLLATVARYSLLLSSSPNDRTFWRRP